MLTRAYQALPHSTRNILSGLLAFGLAELSVRVVRLVTVILIARQLAPDIVGQAALTLTLFEIIRILANVGIGQQIIAAPDAMLGAICNTAQRLFWIWCGLVAAVQLLCAVLLATLFGQSMAGWMLAVLSLVYAFMPGGLVHCFLLMREGRAGVTARTAAIQTIADHLLTALLLMLWPNPWSIVLPKLLTAPVWLILTRRARSWHRVPADGEVPYRSLLGFGLSVLLTEMAVAIRNQADKLLVSMLFGVTALGTYFFAFNAGIGIMSSLITAFGTVTFPTLCAARPGRIRAQRLMQALMIGAVLFLPLICAQSALAQLYVPVIFGSHWAHASSLVAILCLAAISMFVSSAATAWLRAEGVPQRDAKIQVVAGCAALTGLALGAASGSLEVAAMGWVAGQSFVLIPFAAHTLFKPLGRVWPHRRKGAIA